MTVTNPLHPHLTVVRCLDADPAVCTVEAVVDALAASPDPAWIAFVAPDAHAAAVDAFATAALATVATGAVWVVGAVPVTDALKAVRADAGSGPGSRMLVEASVDRAPFRRLVTPLLAPRSSVEDVLAAAIAAGHDRLRPVPLLLEQLGPAHAFAVDAG